MEHNQDKVITNKCACCGALLTATDDTHYVCEYCGSAYLATEGGSLMQTQRPTKGPQAAASKGRALGSSQRISTQTITLGALLTAMVIVLQLLGSFIRFGMFSISLVLVPIVIGAATCGPLIASWLGLVFGVTVLMSGDAAAFLTIHAPGTILVVLLKGIACGLCAALIYRVTGRFGKYVAVLCSALVCPLVNTGIFLIGCRLFFWDTVAAWGAAAGFANAAAYAFLGLAGGNFLFEVAFNLVLSPVIVRLLSIRKKRA